MDSNFAKYVDKHGPIPVHNPELGPCWLWTGQMRKDGYAAFSKWLSEIRIRKCYLAHRFSYIEHIGPIPAGTTLDHLCRNRGCVSPWHTDPVTQKVNVLRGESFSAINARKTTCLRGHNMVESPWKSRGGRICPTCIEARNISRRKKKG